MKKSVHEPPIDNPPLLAKGVVLAVALIVLAVSFFALYFGWTRTGGH